MNPLAILSLVVGVSALLLAVATAGGLAWKHARCGRVAQLEFLLLLLAGILLVSLGSLLLALAPTTGTCVASVWAIVVGYALQVVPLVVKAATIVFIVKESAKMNRVNVDKHELLKGSVALSSTAVLYCLLWTYFDAPQIQRDADGVSYCDWGSHAWYAIFLACQGIGNVKLGFLAYGMRNAPDVICESHEISLMILLSAIMMIFRTLVYVVSIVSPDAHGAEVINYLPSFFFATEMIGLVVLYFPRFFQDV